MIGKSRLVIGSLEGQHDIAVLDVKHAKYAEVVAVVNTVLRVVALATSRPSAPKIRKLRETSTGSPAVGTGTSRGSNIPSV